MTRGENVDVSVEMKQLENSEKSRLRLRYLSKFEKRECECTDRFYLFDHVFFPFE